MAVREVLVYPNQALRAGAEAVTSFDGRLKKLISDMWETMYFSKGVGLAAPQIGVPLKVVVIDWEENKYLLINPVILEQDGEERLEEGCLSFPGIYEEVTRPNKVRVTWQDENGASRDEVMEGFIARVFSHEIDHLSAKLLIDHLSPLKRRFLKKKMERKNKAK
ncbi:MAG: peptide deformylase [Synergistaceae bacterium]|jgi:peptide deformylase|nr:peptide deformylase [Synergistaceae bacterium]